MGRCRKGPVYRGGGCAFGAGIKWAKSSKEEKKEKELDAAGCGAQGYKRKRGKAIAANRGTPSSYEIRHLL